MAGKLHFRNQFCIYLFALFISPGLQKAFWKWINMIYRKSMMSLKEYIDFSLIDKEVLTK